MRVTEGLASAFDRQRHCVGCLPFRAEVRRCGAPAAMARALTYMIGVSELAFAFHLDVARIVQHHHHDAAVLRPS